MAVNPKTPPVYYSWLLLTLLCNCQASHALDDRPLEPQDSESITELLRDLKDRDETIRTKAAEDLGKRGRKAIAAVPHLVRALEKDNAEVRKSAACALYDIQGKEALPVIVKALRSESDPNARFVLVTIVMQWGRDRGPEVEQIVPALIETLKLDYEKYDLAIDSARVALLIVGPKAVPNLVSICKDGQEKTIKRITAIEVLSSMKEEAKHAAPAMIELLKERDKEVVAKAIYCLGKIDLKQKQSVNAIEDIGLRSRSVNIKMEAADALLCLDRRNKNILPLVRSTLKRGNRAERYRAMAAAECLGSDARSLVPMLLGELKDKYPNNRMWAVRALGSIAPQDKGVIAALESATRDPIGSVSGEALKILNLIKTQEKNDLQQSKTKKD